jgi:hypothetical protein
MRRLVCFLAALIVATALVGCGGGEKERGQNRDYDKPQAPEKDK